MSFWREWLDRPLSFASFYWSIWGISSTCKSGTQFAPKQRGWWTFIGAAGKTSAIHIYNLLLDQKEEHPFFSIIWRSSSRLKHKILFWLVAHCRINTRALLLRKGMKLDDIHCPTGTNKLRRPLCTYYGTATLLRIVGIPWFHIGKEAHQFMMITHWPFHSCQSSLHLRSSFSAAGIYGSSRHWLAS